MAVTTEPPEAGSTRRLRARQRLWASLLRLAARLERAFDAVKWSLRRRFGRLGPLQIVSYRGFGSPSKVRLFGRIVEIRRHVPPGHPRGHLGNVVRMVRRFLSRELPGARVRVRLGEAAVETVTDQEGYYALSMPTPRMVVDADGWAAGEAEVVDAPVAGLRSTRARVEALVPDPGAEHGIVSDIDDTVLQTHVTRRLRMIWVTLVGNAETRLPFEGTCELFQALCAGASGTARNPVFYLSKSPWNLYDLLTEFLERQNLPRGPLLLRDIGLHARPPLDVKETQLAEILETYPHLPFVLIGDSGERDPDIYLQVAGRYPGRIRAIYIREVGEGRQRRRELADMPDKARALGCEMLLVRHAREALDHARHHGLAAPAARAPAARPT